ncbi:MAG: hypothetical protein MI921_25155 [Cytophagales bacterium]|nr:hypothetical protein [Cytophagales bacterium]
MHRHIFFILIFSSGYIYGQQGSEIYLFDLAIALDNVSIANPINITERPGYDNQPHFYHKGKKVLFTSMEAGNHTNIYSYNLKSGKTKKIFNTYVSEYSPIPIEKDKYFTCIVVEENGDQRLWKYKMNGRGRSPVFEHIKFVGYHCWIDDQRLGLFIVGEPNTLQIGNTITGNSLRVTEKIGRALHPMPGENLLTFVQKKDAIHWVIKSVNPDNLVMTDVIDTLPGSEDFCILNDGTFLMGQGNALFKYNAKTDIDWSKVADLSDYGITSNFNRLTVSANNKKLAVVVME